MTPREYWRQCTRLAIQSIREGRLPRELLSDYWRKYRSSRKSLRAMV